MVTQLAASASLETSPSSALTGLGVSATAAEAAAYARYKLDGGPAPWTRLSYLSIGVSAREDILPELPALLREADLQASAHLLEVNLVRPIAGQREAMAALYGKIEQLAPTCVEED